MYINTQVRGSGVWWSKASDPSNTPAQRMKFTLPITSPACSVSNLSTWWWDTVHHLKRHFNSRKALPWLLRPLQQIDVSRHATHNSHHPPQCSNKAIIISIENILILKPLASGSWHLTGIGMSWQTERIRGMIRERRGGEHKIGYCDHKTNKIK
jgi:hypothetical protein